MLLSNLYSSQNTWKALQASQSPLLHASQTKTMGLLPMAHARLPDRKTKVIISPDAADAAFPWKEGQGHVLTWAEGSYKIKSSKHHTFISEENVGI